MSANRISDIGAEALSGVNCIEELEAVEEADVGLGEELRIDSPCPGEFLSGVAVRCKPFCEMTRSSNFQDPDLVNACRLGEVSKCGLEFEGEFLW